MNLFYFIVYFICKCVWNEPFRYFRCQEGFIFILLTNKANVTVLLEPLMLWLCRILQDICKKCNIVKAFRTFRDIILSHYGVGSNTITTKHSHRPLFQPCTMWGLSTVLTVELTICVCVCPCICACVCVLSWHGMDSCSTTLTVHVFQGTEERPQEQHKGIKKKVGLVYLWWLIFFSSVINNDWQQEIHKQLVTQHLENV